MKIILKEDVRGVGKAGAVVEVAEGYGRNFLVPRGLALEATSGNLAHLASLKAASTKRDDKRLSEVKDMAALLERQPVTVKAKAGDQGRLFGAVTNAQIADSLKAGLGIDIDRHKIDLGEPIKSAGDHPCVVKLGSGISAKITVRVVTA
ncbi:MAG: 50S ribosomal protein L9 [Candidatus Eremiobacteraeota bacterium]|nr:50S ribosomal protein L9 [Candidatus Eremiobacteraeota bacterium]MBC5828279.1 50S ribosomal protein L9 [Candidatus Eremiobacteraeota bacterium]